MARWTDGHMVSVAPKRDLITGLDAQLVTQLLRDHHLALGTDTMSHTMKYNRLKWMRY